MAKKHTRPTTDDLGHAAGVMDVVSKGTDVNCEGNVGYSGAPHLDTRNIMININVALYK